MEMAWAHIGSRILNMVVNALDSIITLLYYVHERSELTPKLAFFCVSVLSLVNLFLNYFRRSGGSHTFSSASNFPQNY